MSNLITSFIGFTGHRNLQDEVAVLSALRATFAPWLAQPKAIRPLLLTGYAEGADRLAVQAWTEGGGLVHYLFPYADPNSEDHAWTDDPATAGEECRIALDSLPGIKAVGSTKRDNDRITIPKPHATKSAHVCVAELLAKHADHLVAAWDGVPRPGDGSKDGGTAHVVEIAGQKASIIEVT